MRTRRRHVIGGGRGTSQQREQSASAVFIRQPWSTLRWPPSNFVMECGYTCEPIAFLFFAHVPYETFYVVWVSSPHEFHHNGWKVAGWREARPLRVQSK